MPKRPHDLIYAVDERPPWGRLAMLGAQHAVLMSVYLVLIVIIARTAGASDAVVLSMLSFSMIVLAVASALQASPFGSGFLAVPVYSAIYLGPSVLAAKTGGLPLVFGMTIFAGLVEIALALFLRRLRWVFPPAVSGFIVCIVGLDLGLVGMKHALAIGTFETARAELPFHVIVSVSTLVIAVAATVWGRGAVRLIASLIGLVVGMAMAIFFGLVTPDSMHTMEEAGLVAFPGVSHISFAFDPKLMPAFLAAAVAAALRTIGVITTCQKINDADWKRPDFSNLKRGTIADGLSCIIAGLLGTPGLNTAPSLVGVSSAAQATSRWIAYACAGVLLIMSLVPKVGAVFLMLPLAVAGGILVFTASLMISAGIGIMVSRNVDVRATFVIGISMLLALTREMFPTYFNTLPEAFRSFTGGTLAIGVLAAIALTMAFRLGSRHSFVAAGGDAESIDAFLAQIPARCAAWKVSADVTQACLADATEIVESLRGPDGVERFDTCRLVYDEVDLAVEFAYVGPLPRFPTTQIDKKHLDEEQAFARGISMFLANIGPSNIETRTDGHRSTIKLTYES
jgi:NCS2 family nucleobase:cation symporter-2